MKTVTIKDVARQAGVSISTVSHVVNGTRVVAPETKIRVEKTIHDLGYVPNAAAKNLKSGELPTIAMIVERSSNPFFAEVVQAFEEECSKHQCLVTISACGARAQDQLSLLEFQKSRGVDGFAIMLETITEPLLAQLEKMVPSPIVILDAAQSANIPAVTDNSNSGGQIAAEHLRDCGRKNVLILGGPEMHHRMGSRLEGFLDVWKGPHNIIHCPLSFEGGFAAVMTLAQTDAPALEVDCVMGMNDATAIGAMAALKKLGKRIPEDISIMGYDDIELCRYVWPQLTTVTQHTGQLGKRAAHHLLHQIRKDTVKLEDSCITPHLIVRESSCVPDAD